MTSTKKPLFSVAERLGLAREIRQATRRAQAQHKRTLAALAIEERARQLHVRLDNFETAVAIGRMLTELRVSGWKKPLVRLGIVAPLETLERSAKLARTQLDRFLSEEAPGMLARSEAVARAIEGIGESHDAGPDEREPTNGANGVEPDGVSRGRYG